MCVELFGASLLFEEWPTQMKSVWANEESVWADCNLKTRNSLTENIKLNLSLRFILLLLFVGLHNLWFLSFLAENTPPPEITKPIQKNHADSSTTMVHTDFNCYLSIKWLPKTHYMRLNWDSMFKFLGGEEQPNLPLVCVSHAGNI